MKKVNGTVLVEEPLCSVIDTKNPEWVPHYRRPKPRWPWSLTAARFIYPPAKLPWTCKDKSLQMQSHVTPTLITANKCFPEKHDQFDICLLLWSDLWLFILTVCLRWAVLLRSVCQSRTERLSCGLHVRCIPRVCVRTRVARSNVTRAWDACLVLLTYKNCLFETFLHFIAFDFGRTCDYDQCFSINRFVFVQRFFSLFHQQEEFFGFIHDQFTCACKNAKSAHAKVAFDCINICQVLQ